MEALAVDINSINNVSVTADSLPLTYRHLMDSRRDSGERDGRNR